MHLNLLEFFCQHFALQIRIIFYKLYYTFYINIIYINNTMESKPTLLKVFLQKGKYTF
jgi:hypothetical protein